jgi:hypothetical protein
VNGLAGSIAVKGAEYAIMYYVAPAIAKRIVAGALSGISGPADVAEKVRDGIIDIIKGINQAINSKDFQDEFKEFGKAIGNTHVSFWTPIKDAFTRLFDDAMKDLSWSVVRTWVPTIALYMTAYVGTPLVLKYLYEKAFIALGRPKLLIESRKITWLTPFFNRCQRVTDYIFGRKPAPKAIFCADLQRRVNELTTATKNILKNKGFPQFLLLYGPPGTGKTLIAQEIARNTGMNYVSMSGADLAQYIKAGKSVHELNVMLDRAYNNWSGRPTIIFIDEVDALAGRRDKMDQEHVELLNALLQKTGTPNKRIMFISATNRLDSIDEAWLNRNDRVWYVGPPGLSERVAILRLYVDHIFDKKAVEKEQFFRDGQLTGIALKTSGLTGRGLFKLVNAIHCKKSTTPDNKLTIRLVNQTISDFVTQERQLPGAVRSWRIVELVSDLFLFTIPDFFICLAEVIQNMVAAVKKEGSPMLALQKKLKAMANSQ